MNAVRLIPVILSFLLLAAHFLRSGPTVIAAALALFPLLLLLSRPWVARLTQIVLFVGGLEWIRTLLVFVAMRRELGQPWTRLAVILGIVALVTIGSGLLFSHSRALRTRYGLGRED